MSANMVSKRYYAHIKSDLRMIKKFADALCAGGIVRVDAGDVLTPKSYKVFPDGVRFDCEKSSGLSLYNDEQRKRRFQAHLRRII